MNLDQRPDQDRRQPSGLAARVAATIITIAAAAFAVGCATSPPPVRFHSLIAPDAPFLEPTAPAGLMRISIVPVRIPASIDRPQWLVRRPDDSLQMLEGDRWVAPLAEEFRFAIRARLASRWGIVDAARPSSGSEIAPVAWRLVIDVLRLEARPGAETLLEARWTLLPPREGGAGVACAARITEPVETVGTQALIEAYRRSVTLLSDRIGEQLRAIAAGGAPGCGTGPGSAL